MSDPELDQAVEEELAAEDAINDANNDNSVNDDNESDVETVKQDNRAPQQSHETWAKATGYSPGHVTPTNYGSFNTDGAQSPLYEGSDSVDGPNGAGRLTNALRARVLRARTRVNTTDWIALRTGMRPSRRA